MLKQLSNYIEIRVILIYDCLITLEMNITDQLNKFIDFVEIPNKLSEDEKNQQLEFELINLYLLYLNIETKQSKDLKKKFDYNKEREIILKNFKHLGYYNDTLEIDDNIGETEITVGDAIDDLTDIIISLKEALSYKHEKDTIGHLKLSFEFHTREHMINLLRYINPIKI